MRTIVLSVLLLTAAGCHLKSDDERMQEIFESNRRYSEEHTGHFPPVTVGMKYSELEQQIRALNPVREDGYCNVLIEHTSQVMDTTSYMYWVSRASDADHVLVTVRNGVVVGYSR